MKKARPTVVTPGEGGGYWLVTAWARANVRDAPWLSGEIVSYVVAGGNYSGICWVRGQEITAEGITNDVWVKLRLDSGGVGYVSAIYLKGDERGNVGEAC